MRLLLITLQRLRVSWVTQPLGWFILYRIKTPPLLLEPPSPFSSPLGCSLSTDSSYFGSPWLEHPLPQAPPCLSRLPLVGRRWGDCKWAPPPWAPFPLGCLQPEQMRSLSSGTLSAPPPPMQSCLVGSIQTAFKFSPWDSRARPSWALACFQHGPPLPQYQALSYPGLAWDPAVART